MKILCKPSAALGDDQLLGPAEAVLVGQACRDIQLEMLIVLTMRKPLNRFEVGCALP